MNDFIVVFGSIILAFLLGSVVWLFLLRGFIIPWLSVRRSGNLALVQINTKGSFLGKFRVAKRIAAGVYEYKDGKDEEGKDNIFMIGAGEGCLRRILRVNWLTVNEGDTAALNPTKIYKKEEDVKVPVMDKDGKTQKLDVNNKPLFEVRRIIRVAFYESWDDAHLFHNLIIRAAQKPKLPLGGVFGAFDMKKVLIGVGVIIAGIVLFMYMQSNGVNVIP